MGAESKVLHWPAASKSTSLDQLQPCPLLAQPNMAWIAGEVISIKQMPQPVDREQQRQPIHCSVTSMVMASMKVGLVTSPH
jgi:hypothetical protein